MRILIVDNDKNTAETLKAALETSPGLEVDLAYDGADALKLMASDGIYGLVLLDLMMPEMNGIETCKKMAEEERLKDIPVILISALPIESEAFKDSLGAFNELRSVKDVLEKPFTLSQLNEKVSAIIDGRYGNER